MISGTESNRLKVATVLGLFTVIPVGESIYEALGRLSAALSLNGNSIGDFDEVIAASPSGSTGRSSLVTAILKVPRLKVISY